MKETYRIIDLTDMFRYKFHLNDDILIHIFEDADKDLQNAV